MPRIHTQCACVSNLGTGFPCGVAKADITGKERNNKMIGWTTLWKHLQHKNQKQQVGRTETGQGTGANLGPKPRG